MYKGTVEYYNVAVFYPALYIGILNLCACAFSVVGGIALSKRRYFPLTLTSIFLLLASGIAAPIAWGLYGYIWFNGLLLGAFQIVVSLIVLVSLVVRRVK